MKNRFLCKPSIYTLAGLFTALSLNSGCTSIGQNRGYAFDFNCSNKEIPEKKECLNTRPFSLTDLYDFNEKDVVPVREGSPLNIIVNRVHIEDNSEDIYELIDQAEIGVVLSVDDGTEEGGKDVLVSYEHGIEDKVDLPISDLLAYSTTNYINQPIRVSLTIFEFDQKENEMLRGILQTAANSVAAANPAYAPAAGLASQLGSYLLSHNADDIVIKFTFTLYPWPQGEQLHPKTNFGIPRIRFGQFIVLNAEADNAKLVNSTDDLIVNWNMEVWTKDGLGDRIPTNYLILTVDPNTTLANASHIINRADEFARQTAGLPNNGKLGATTPSALNEQIASLGSSIRLFGITREFNSRKKAPEAMRILWETYNLPDIDPNALNKNDKITLLGQIRSKLPTKLLNDEPCKTDVGKPECMNHFLKSNYIFDDKEDRYKAEKSKESDNNQTQLE